MSVPCKDCDKRSVGCHATCDAYKAFDDERKAEREHRRKDDVVHDYTRESFVRCQRKAAKKVVKRLSHEQKG